MSDPTHAAASMDAGDTARLLCCSALVLLMTPGLGFFYGGHARANASAAVNTIKMSLLTLVVVAIEWAALGYSMAFGPGNAIFGGFEHAGLAGIGSEPRSGESIPHSGIAVFQMVFAILAPVLISGALAGRMRIKAYVVFIALWSLLVYAPLARWVWSNEGWLRKLGAIDFAGGTVVHVSAGVSALVAAWILGPRSPFTIAGSGRRDRPHSARFVVLGASLLCFGWFGVRAGSALGTPDTAALAAMTTMLGAAGSVVCWFAVDVFLRRKSTAAGAAIAAVIGLVAITPGAGFVTPPASIAIGALSAIACRLVRHWLRDTSLDDTLDMFACHGVGGIVGALLTGVFATSAANPHGSDGLLAGHPSLVWTQFVGTAVAAALAAAGTVIALALISSWTPLRWSKRDERMGIDTTKHADAVYAMEANVVTMMVNNARRTAPTRKPSPRPGTQCPRL
ncbi:MAG: ammonium transporter [Planctomycetota bacterium]